MAVLARGGRGSTASRGSRSEDVRRRNLAALVGHVHVHGPTPRSMLATALELNRSTIGDLTAELVSAGLVREEIGRPTGATARSGRPSFVVVPQSQLVQVLAVDVGVTHLTVARMGLGGQLLARRDVPRPRGPRGLADLVATIRRVARQLAAAQPDALCVGAGVAVPGMVRAADGLVRQAPNLGWTGVPMGEQLGHALGLPVHVGNDADLGVLAEHTRGAGVGCDDVLYLVGHSGIGAGVVTSGRPLVGSHGYAGEVGHVVVNPDGIACHCGARGCWETEVGEERLFQLAGQPPEGGLRGVRRVVSAVAAGDASAAAALEQVAWWLGTGVAAVVNVFNPSVVILGGALAEIYAAAGPAVRRAAAAAILPPHRDGLRLVLPAFGIDSTLVGAGELAFAPLLRDPLAVTARRDAS